MERNRLELNGRFPDDPESVVRELWQQAHSMGGNDSEGPAFELILERLHSGASSPQEAIREARAIVGRKQDYH